MVHQKKNFEEIQTFIFISRLATSLIGVTILSEIFKSAIRI